MDKFIFCFVPGPSQWLFHFGEEIVIAWTHIGWVRWMSQNLPWPATQEFRDDSMSGVTPYIYIWVLYHQMSFSPEHWTKVVLQERAVVGSVGGTARCCVTP